MRSSIVGIRSVIKGSFDVGRRTVVRGTVIDFWAGAGADGGFCSCWFLVDILFKLQENGKQSNDITKNN